MPIGFSIWFGLGVVIEAVLLLNTNGRRIDKRDAIILAACVLAAAVLGFFTSAEFDPAKWPTNFPIAIFLVFAIAFAASFKGRILPVVDEQVLLVWNIIFCYAWFSRFPELDAIGIVIALISLTT